jgi:hypothetical protein
MPQGCRSRLRVVQTSPGMLQSLSDDIGTIYSQLTFSFNSTARKNARRCTGASTKISANLI